MSSGLHLCIDGTTATPLTFGRIERFLRHFPWLVGLHRITEPVVVEQEGGYCGVVIIAESHISVHTRGCQVWADCFSCVGFNRPTEQVTRAVVRLLWLTDYKVEILPRAMPNPMHQLVTSHDVV